MSLIVIVLLGGLYLVPIFLAFARDVKNPHGIGALNLFLGWTLIGWVGALVWACTAETEADAAAHDEERAMLREILTERNRTSDTDHR